MMDFFQDHRLLSTLLALAVAIAATVLLFVLSSTADLKPRAGTATATTPAVQQYAPEGALDDGNANDAVGAETEDRPDDGSESALGGDEEINQAISASIDAGATVESTQYVDVDGDGTMEILVQARGDDESRPLDWYLLDKSSAGVQVLFERKGVAQGEIKVDGPRIVEREGLYQPADESCCPSQLKLTYYVWKDGSLVVSSVEQPPPGAAP